MVIIQGTDQAQTDDKYDINKLMELLLEELPLKKAAAVASKITGKGKNEMYQIGLTLQDRMDTQDNNHR